jgi:hypothetical protein
MFDAMVNKSSLLYAPFTTRLIEDTIRDHDFGARSTKSRGSM